MINFEKIMPVAFVGAVLGFVYGVGVLALSFTVNFSKVLDYPSILSGIGLLIFLCIGFNPAFRKDRGFTMQKALQSLPKTVLVLILGVAVATVYLTWTRESYQGDPQMEDGRLVLKRNDQVVKILIPAEFSRMVRERTQQKFELGNLFFCFFLFMLWPRKVRYESSIDSISP
jgi:hypothetical protein